MSGNENKEEILTKKEKVLRVMDIMGELFVLNLIFILFSLPVFTLGASLTALYSMTIKIVKNEEGALWSGYVNAFKKNIKQATIALFIMLFYLVVLFAQYLLVISLGDTWGFVYLIILIFTAVLGMLVLAFLFPLIARYNNSIYGTVKNSFLLSVSNLGACIKITCLWAGPIGISVIYPQIFMFSWFIWPLFMFSLISYISSMIMVKVFERVESSNK